MGVAAQSDTQVRWSNTGLLPPIFGVTEMKCIKNSGPHMTSYQCSCESCKEETRIENERINRYWDSIGEDMLAGASSE